MKINKNLFTISVGFAVLLCLEGCSDLKNGSNLEGNSVSDSIPKTESKTVITFDKKLAEIEDQNSAEEAVSFFADYALSNQVDRTYIPKTNDGSTDKRADLSFKKQSGLDIDVVKLFATIETKVRDVDGNQLIPLSFKLQEMEDDQSLISITKLTTIVNQLKMVDEGYGFSESDIRNNQHIIRENIPHLASTDSELMTPLEASVIMYYIMTGDDGSASQGSPLLLANNDDIKKFMLLLTDQGDL